MISCIMAVVEGHVGARLELAVDVGVVGHLVGPRVDVDDRGAEAARLLEEARRHRVVGGGVAAGDDGHVRVDHVAVGGGDRAGADALEQGGHAGGVAQPGAVVHVVGVEPGPDQLLEEVGLLVGALGRAEAGDRGRAAGRVDLGQPAGHQVQRLLPAGLAEVRHDLGVVDQAAGLAAAAPFLGGVARHLAAARRRRARPWGRTPRGGSAAWSAAAARPRSPSRSGPSRTAGRASRAAPGPRRRRSHCARGPRSRSARSRRRSTGRPCPPRPVRCAAGSGSRGWACWSARRSGRPRRIRRRRRRRSSPSGRSGRTRSGWRSPCRCAR